jgi:hypothetical protein
MRMTHLRSLAATVLAALLTCGPSSALGAAAAASAPAALVELAINTAPPASVVVDGAATGKQTPLWPGQGLMLPVGQHEIVFENSDGARYAYVVVLGAGDTAKRLIIKRLGGPPGGDVEARLAGPDPNGQAASLPRETIGQPTFADSAPATDPAARLRAQLQKRGLLFGDAKQLWPELTANAIDPQRSDGERRSALDAIARELERFQFTRAFIDKKLARVQRSYAEVRPRLNKQSAMFRDLEFKQQKVLEVYASASNDPARLATANKLINEMELALQLAQR